MSRRSRKVTAAIVGAGLMGRWHANAIDKAGGRVLAIVDIDGSAAGRLAQHCNGASAFVDLEQMLLTRVPDVVHVCSPAPTHYAVAERAIKAGCHLLVEKPMTPTALETERLFAIAADRHVILCPVHQFLFQDGVLKARQLLSKIGALIDIQAVIVSAGGADSAHEQLDALVAEILPHPLSLLQVFLPSTFGAARWTAVRSGNGELRLFGEASGTSLFIFISMNARPTSNIFQIKGTKGTIYVNLFHGYSFVESGEVSRFHKMTQPFRYSLVNSGSAALNLGRRVLSRETAYPGLQRLIMSFYAAVRTDLPPPISPEDTINVAILRDQLIKAGGLAFQREA